MSELRRDDSAGESRIEESGGRETTPCLVCLRGVSVMVAAIDIGGTGWGEGQKESGGELDWLQKGTPAKPARQRKEIFRPTLPEERRRQCLFYVSTTVYLSPWPSQWRNAITHTKTV